MRLGGKFLAVRTTVFLFKRLMSIFWMKIMQKIVLKPRVISIWSKRGRTVGI